MLPFSLRTIFLGFLGYFTYSAAIACSCAGDGWSEDQLAVSGEVGPRSAGCGATSTRKLTVTDVHQDPSGTVAVGDTLRVEFSEGSGSSSCDVDLDAGDQVTVWGDPNGLRAGLCNSDVY